MYRKYLTVILLFIFNQTFAQQTIPLYPGGIPNAKQVVNEEFTPDQNVYFKISQPSLSIYLPRPELANGTAVIICPGGSYSGVWMKIQGSDVAKEMNAKGVAAFVLKYRIPDDKTMIDKSIGPLQDAQQAIKTVREHAVEWRIDTNRIGIMGFSAGGHLAATAGTHFNHSFIENNKHTSLRPDFMILVYPVISFNDLITHKDSKENLIGKHPQDSLVDYYSNELQVNKQTPPTFLIHGEDDQLVNVKNSINFYLSLFQFSVPAGMHIFPKGEHGFFSEPSHSNWFRYCSEWMHENGWIVNKPTAIINQDTIKQSNHSVKSIKNKK